MFFGLPQQSIQQHASSASALWVKHVEGQALPDGRAQRAAAPRPSGPQATGQWSADRPESHREDTVLLVSMILEQYRGCFSRMYLMSPSVDKDSAWDPEKDYIHDEDALRRIIEQQKRITQQSKRLDMRKLYRGLVVLDDLAPSPQPHEPLKPYTPNPSKPHKPEILNTINPKALKP